MHSVLFKFVLVLNYVLMFWKLLVFEFLLGISEIFLCSIFALLLDVHRLPIFARTLTYLEPTTYSLIILQYNML
jgi:hypothetical protein